MHTQSTAAYKPTVRLTTHRGHYRVQLGTNPSVWYETSANQCSCPARKPCKHMRYVRVLNVSFYVRRKVTAPACTTVEEEHAGVTSSRGSTIVATPIVDVEANEAEPWHDDPAHVALELGRLADVYTALASMSTAIMQMEQKGARPSARAKP